MKKENKYFDNTGFPTGKIEWWHLILFALLSTLFGIALAKTGLADNEFGKITSGNNLIITRVDVKVDGLTSRNLDYNGEISRKAKPSSTVILSIKTENNNDTFKIEDIVVMASIDELDLEKVLSEFDLEPSKSKTSEIEFKLPSDAEDKDYDVFIEAEGDLVNGTTKTTQRVEYALDLVVEIPEEEQVSSIIKIEDLDKSIQNLSREIGSYFEPYTICDSDRSKLQEQVMAKDAELQNFNEYKARFDSCSSQKESCNNEKYNFEKEFELCKYNITNIHIPELAKTKNIFWMIIVGLLILGGGAYLYKEKIKKPMGEMEEKETTEIR